MKYTKQGIRDLNGIRMDGVYNGKPKHPEQKDVNIDRMPKKHDPRRCDNPLCEICFYKA